MANDPNEGTSPVGTGTDGKLIMDQDDLSDSRKETLGSYLTNKTRGISLENSNQYQGIESANHYDIPDAKETIGIYSRESGLPTGPTTISTDESGFLAKASDLEDLAITYFNSLSKGYVDGDELRAGGTFTSDELPDKNSQVDGHSWLHKTADNESTSNISAVLTNNRFSRTKNNPMNRFVAATRQGIGTKQFADDQSIDPARSFVSANNIDRLSRVGRTLLLSATGDREKISGDGATIELSNLENSEAMRADNNSLMNMGGAAGNLLTNTLTTDVGSVPLGSRRVPVEHMYTENADGFKDGEYPEGMFNDSDFHNRNATYTDKSYGNLNSYLEPFLSSQAAGSINYQQSITNLFAVLAL